MFKHKSPLVVAIAAESLLTSAAAGADDASLTTQIVDTFYKIYETHPGFRVNHAKGVVAEGSFVATPAASALSRAALFDGSSSIPVTVRFSNDGGLPSVPDGAPSNPKGMAIKFHMPGGASVRASRSPTDNFEAQKIGMLAAISAANLSKSLRCTARLEPR